MAEALLRARLAERGIGMSVGSVGQLFDGRAAEAGAVKAMAERGLDLTQHISQKQSAALIADSSLILGMEKVHVRDLAILKPGTFERTFTLPEFVRIVEGVPPRAGGDLREWVERLGSERDHLGYLSDMTADAVADPMGRSNRVFRACAAEIEGLIDRMVERVWPVATPDAQ